MMKTNPQSKTDELINYDLDVPKRNPRRFLPEDFSITDWEAIKPYFEDLLSREINSVEGLTEWLYDRGELEAVLREDLSWRYIKMTIDTADEGIKKAYQFFVTEIHPKAAPYYNDLDKKLVDSPFADALNPVKFGIYLKRVRNRIRLYRHENIPLFSELSVKEQEFGEISGAMTIEYQGQEMTLQQAANKLKSTDRQEREEVYRLIGNRRLQDKEKLDDLFDQLLQLRHQVARNAGYENYRDYKFAELGRFDYTKEDCFEFHESIKAEILPIEEKILARRKKLLGYDDLRPWDLAVEPSGAAPYQPFKTGKDLLNIVKDVFYRLHPYFGQRLEIMDKMNHLDLESRKGKAPGGYNSTLAEIGVPFIFMNASGSSRDVRTMIHEGGHAVHSFLMRDIEFMPNKSIPSEIAEVASMGMELLTMDHWDLIYKDPKELKRAKIEQLEGIFGIFPWVSTIDLFQHWLYTHPEHSREERKAEWVRIFNAYSSELVNYEGLEEMRNYLWQRQLHIFEVPFYYIEYAIAQLGAIAIWRHFKENPEKAMKDYMYSLSLGYTQSLGELYDAAGVQFNFSRGYVRELAQFVWNELEELYD